MENRIRYFLTAFFGSLGLFVVVVFIYSLIRGSELSLIKLTGNILIYYTVPVFILVLACIYLPLRNLYTQIVVSLVIITALLSIWIYFDGMSSRYLKMGFTGYWWMMLKSFGLAIIYFSVSIPLLLKRVKGKGDVTS